MENKILTGIVALLVVLNGYQLIGEREPNFYCEEREIKAYCYNLSSTMKTCYTLPSKQGGKRCSEWKEIPFIEEEVIKPTTQLNKREERCPQRPTPCKKIGD